MMDQDDKNQIHVTHLDNTDFLNMHVIILNPLIYLFYFNLFSIFLLLELY